MTENKVKYVVVINFGEHFKSAREKLYPKLNEERSLRKVVELLYIFRTTPDEIEKYVEIMQSSCSDNCLFHYNINIVKLFHPELQLANTKPIFKNKLKELLNELKKFKVQLILVLISRIKATY